MPITNTLETARRLEALGFPHQQAQGLSELFEATASDARREVATRADLEALREALRGEIRLAVAELRSEFREELRKQMLWFFATQVALFGALAAFVKMFP